MIPALILLLNQDLLANIRVIATYASPRTHVMIHTEIVIFFHYVLIIDAEKTALGTAIYLFASIVHMYVSGRSLKTSWSMQRCMR